MSLHRVCKHHSSTHVHVYRYIIPITIYKCVPPLTLFHFCHSMMIVWSFIYSQLTYNPSTIGFGTSQSISLQRCDPTEPLAPVVNLSCNRRVDIVTGLIEIHMNWNYEYIPLIEDAIAVYNIFFSSVIDGHTRSGKNIALDPQVNVNLVHLKC